MAAAAGAGLSCKEAIQAWAAKSGQDPATATRVMLNAVIPSIKKMDNKLSELVACE
jgi:hypothetical protein